MIKANELMIGNLVQNGSEVEEVTSISKQSISTNKTQNAEGLEPIPITGEWLLKFGFEKKTVWMNNIKYEGWKKFSFHIDINYRENSFFYHWNGGNIELKNVHQLQNLYFALTGNKLEIR